LGGLPWRKAADHIDTYCFSKHTLEKGSWILTKLKADDIPVTPPAAVEIAKIRKISADRRLSQKTNKARQHAGNLGGMPGYNQNERSAIISAPHSL
jgi:hypothetical protein